MISLFPSRQIFLSVGQFLIHWYGIMYLCAFLVALWMLPRLRHHRSSLKLQPEHWSELLTLGVLGVLAGGRLGFVVFYEPLYFLQHPLDVFAVWKGGMSSHGGVLGVTAALWLFCRKHSVPLLALADIVVVPAAIGLALGRMGNFINGELYGTVTDLPWGMAFPGVEGMRHPTQLYAMAKDLFIAIACYLTLCHRQTSGLPTAVFFMLYGVLRFLLEFLRVPSHEPLPLAGLILTRGQWLTIPLVLFGVVLWRYASRWRQHDQ